MFPPPPARSQYSVLIRVRVTCNPNLQTMAVERKDPHCPLPGTVWQYAWDCVAVDCKIHCPLPTAVWQSTEGSRPPKSRPQNRPARAWRRMGGGNSSSTIRRRGRVSQGSLGQHWREGRALCHRGTTHYAQRVLTHTALLVCIFPHARPSGHCAVRLAHHTTKHNTTPNHTTQPMGGGGTILMPSHRGGPPQRGYSSHERQWWGWFRVGSICV